MLTIANRTQQLDLVVPYQTHQIKEVGVTRRSIATRGDTTVYLVNKFVKGKDVSIGDVIAHMPGFEVSNTGRILYQGQPIQKYYIEGLDLLEGQYSLANRNLPHSAVGAVEVLENHQPVRMLRGIIPTDRTSLNIRLKKKVTATGNIFVGAGLTPFLYNLNLTPMIFNAKQQIIASWQANNVGNDLWSQFKPLTINNITIGGLSNSGPKLISIPSSTRPPIEKERYLFNNVNLLTYNHLIKLSETSELKIGVAYLNDHLKENDMSRTSYQLGDSTFSITEHTHNRYHQNDLSASFSFTQNANSFYLKDNLRFDGYADHEHGTVCKPDTLVAHAETPSLAVDNDLEITIPVGKSFLAVKSKIFYNQQPHHLELQPGVFDKLLNDSIPYASAIQHVGERHLSINNNLGYAKTLGRWTFATDFTNQFEQKQQSSELHIDGQPLAIDSMRNNLMWKYLQLELGEKITFKIPRMYVTLALPLRAVGYHFTDRYNISPSPLAKLYINPIVYLNWKIYGFWSSSFSIAYHERLNNPSTLAQGYALTGYRSIQRNIGQLGSQHALTGTARIHYKNAITGFFLSLDATRHINQNDYIFSRRLQPNGTVVNRALPFRNTNTFDHLQMTSSWTLTKISTILALKASYTHQNGDYIFNDEIKNATTHSYTISPTISITRWKFIGIDYTYLLSAMLQQRNGKWHQINEHKHKCSLYLYPTAQHFLGVDLELYEVNHDKTNQSSDLLTDITYSYRTKRNRIRLQIKCTNILNVKHITKFNMSENITWFNQYSIRPRQLRVEVSVPITAFIRTKSNN